MFVDWPYTLEGGSQLQSDACITFYDRLIFSVWRMHTNCFFFNEEKKLRHSLNDFAKKRAPKNATTWRDRNKKKERKKSILETAFCCCFCCSLPHYIQSTFVAFCFTINGFAFRFAFLRVFFFFSHSMTKDSALSKVLYRCCHLRFSLIRFYVRNFIFCVLFSFNFSGKTGDNHSAKWKNPSRCARCTASDCIFYCATHKNQCNPFKLIIFCRRAILSLL